MEETAMTGRTSRARSTTRDPAGSAGRPVLLATLGVPFENEAASIAVDSAVESGSLLIVANITMLEPFSLSVILGYDALAEFTPEVSASVRRPVELASSLGVAVEWLRVRSPRPTRALLELTSERGVGLLVFGPAREALKPRVFRHAVRLIRDEAPCLVWVRDDVA